MRRVLISLLLLLAASPAAAKPWRAIMAPGDVAKPHEELEDKCDRCHLSFKGVPNEKCLGCHEAIATRIEKDRGFHGAEKAKPCIQCHGDHVGREGSLTKKGARATFDHAATGFSLAGGHEKVACEKCHDRPLEKVSIACAPCHEDVHQGSLGASCEKCHGAGGWKQGLKTLASHRLSMKGAHADQTCKNCHASGANLTERVACKSCHEQGHGGTSAPCNTCHVVEGWKPATFSHDVCTCAFPGKHQTFDCLGCHIDWRFANTPTRCSGCHDKIRKHEPLGECSLCHSALSWKKKEAFDHNKRSKFKIEGEHLSVDCSRCHKVAGQFRGAPQACEGCHKEQGDEAHGDFGGCAKCHNTGGFDKPTFDHASTGFALSGKHDNLKCQDCHAQKTKGYPGAVKKPSARLQDNLHFASVRSDDILRIAALLTGQSHVPIDAACSHCHQDPHQGQVGDECARCHQTEAWKPSTFDVARHAETKFPLRLKHATVECKLCHVKGQLKGLATTCKDCHFDRHAGRLGDDCAKCHSEAGFVPVEGFDHNVTGFALVGPHAAVACVNCHDGARGELMRRAEKPSECSTCHVPGHGAELGADCQKCHPMSTDPSAKNVSFSAARGMPFFEHAKTGFVLDRRHRAQACKRCHPASGPPPESRCATCHLDPHAGQLGLECADCHRADRWRLARFDHDRAGWPLRGKHSVTPCASCHTSQRWVGLTTDCFDCHARDAGRAKSTVFNHPFGALDCQDCHFSLWRW